MQDSAIVELYWERNESAIEHTENKYGSYLRKIAYNILSDWDDSLENVNDTYLRAWNSMPPHKPCVLSTYLGKITRELSIDTYRKRNRQKRMASQYAISLSELEECLSDGNNLEEAVNLKLLTEAIHTFLQSISKEYRTIFVGRYYFADSIADISGYYGMSEAKVKSILHRTRLSLKKHLEQEGFFV